jgi:hypothetical protein
VCLNVFNTAGLGNVETGYRPCPIRRISSFRLVEFTIIDGTSANYATKKIFLCSSGLKNKGRVSNPPLRIFNIFEIRCLLLGVPTLVWKIGEKTS